MDQPSLYKETKKIVKTLCSLPEINRVSIKGISIPAADAEEAIRMGVERSYHDRFSDVDIQVDIRVSREALSSSIPYFQKHFSRLRLGDGVLGCSFSKNGTAEVLRLCMNSGFRMDLVCTVVEDNRGGSIQDNLKEHHLQAEMEDDAGEEETRKADNFWFVAVQALGKLYRRDYLIADHLVHMLLMETLVLQMEERDRRLNTNIHRYGGAEELAYRQVCLETQEAAAVNRWGEGQDETFRFIAQNLFRAICTYDWLKKEENPDWAERRSIFLRIWEEYALPRRDL